MDNSYEHIVHTIAPVYDSRSRVLILGSLPSVKSREVGFYYGNPKNRFWSVLGSILNEPDISSESTIREKKSLLLEHRVALFDVIRSCDIKGSSDASIRNAVPNDIGKIIEESSIDLILLNGKTSWRLFCRYVLPEIETPDPMGGRETDGSQVIRDQGKTGMVSFDLKGIRSKAVCLPSTSPANAAWGLERLIEAWRVILSFNGS